jgi:D-arabinono-1,4-lactone oxidase/FAD binding domain
MAENDGFTTEIRDWARYVSFQPHLYFRPQDLDELKSFLVGIRQGIFKQKNVRVLGGLHSCSDICVSDAIVDVSDLPRTIEFAADNTFVTASANWHFHDFLLALSERGKSISATGGTDHQTLAGIISTDTAPASPRHAIYDLLEWVEYLTYDEDLKEVVEKRLTKNDPAFQAVIASLGVIGILTKVQFRLINEPYFETTQKIVKLDKILSDIDKTSQLYDFWRIDWIPDTDKGLLWAAKSIPEADADGDYPKDQAENLLVGIFQFLNKVESAGPLLDDAMRLVYVGLAMTYGETKVSGPLRNMLPVDRRAPLHVAMAEWSFNPSDLERLLQSCRKYYQHNGWPNLPIEIELTKTDHAYMSPWNWPGLNYIVKFNFMYLTDVSEAGSEKDEIPAHLHGLWNHLIQDGIPFKAHWGKINFMDYEFVRSHFELGQFKPFITPILLNPYLMERLLPAVETK